MFDDNKQSVNRNIFYQIVTSKTTQTWCYIILVGSVLVYTAVVQNQRSIMELPKKNYQVTIDYKNNKLYDGIVVCANTPQVHSSAKITQPEVNVELKCDISLFSSSLFSIEMDAYTYHPNLLKTKITQVK